MLFFGLGIIAGAAAITILTAVKQEHNSTPTHKDTTPDEIPVSPIVCTPAEKNEDVDSAVRSMAERHQDAAKIVRDAVTIICENSSMSSETDTKLDIISSELDDLLGEV